MTSTPTERGMRPRLRLLLHLAFAVVGVGALGAMIHQVGPAKLGALLAGAVGWLPLLLALEAVRIAADAASTYFLYRRWGSGLPLREILRVQLVAYPVSILAPASRTAAEAMKAQALARLTTGARAAAVATMNQSFALYGGALITVPCLAASLAMTGASVLSLGLALQLVLSAAAGVGLQFVARGRAVGGWLGRRFARVAMAAEQFQTALSEHAPVSALPLSCAVVNRTAQVLQYTILVLAMSGSTSLGRSLLAQGINLVGTSLGDLVPGQLGVTDGAFALSASALGITAADAIAISVLAHFVQMCWVFVGSLIPLAWKPAAAPAPVLIMPPTPERAAAHHDDELAPATPRVVTRA
jgi:hypothetical protein